MTIYSFVCKYLDMTCSTDFEKSGSEFLKFIIPLLRREPNTNTEGLYIAWMMRNNNDILGIICCKVTPWAEAESDLCDSIREIRCLILCCFEAGMGD